MDEATPLARLLDQRIQRVEEALDAPSPNEVELLAQLHDLYERFAQERLQLAVIGQFKRGKSSLLNALIGEDLLPSGVLPVTAITTFLEPGEWKIFVRFDEGRQEIIEAGNPQEMHAALRMLVSEGGNPRNWKGVHEVRVRLHSPLLDAGIILLDTPGIGSTLEHNSEAAEAALPEADVALFVLSPDPPITPVEIDYLKAASEHVARIIVLLNKSDLLSNGERQETIDFVRDTIRTKAGFEVDEIVCISARSALAAKKTDDSEMLGQSGLPALEERLIRFAAREKRDSLAEALRKKSARLIASLQLENEVALRALQLPLDELARCAGELKESLTRIDLERLRARDLLAGDKARLIQRMRQRADEIGGEIGRETMADLDSSIGHATETDRLAHDLLPRMTGRFSERFPAFRALVAADLKSILEGHLANADRLAGAICDSAAKVLGVSLPAAGADIEADVDLKPAWYDRRIESLAPVPSDLVDAFLPAGIRIRRVKARLRKDLEVALVRNIEKMRWSVQQAIEDSIRTFQASLDRQLGELKASTADAVQLALDRRRSESAERRDQVGARMRIRTLLSELGSERGFEARVAPGKPAAERPAEAPEDA
jgi:GTPase Era involved in 16S rRNA processing